MAEGGLSMDRITGSKSTMIAVIGSLVAFFGSFMTWASFAGISVGGMGEGRDGIISFIAAIVTAGAAIFLKGRARMITLIIGAAAMLLVAIANMLDINDAGLSIGIGLWMVLVGGIGVAAAAFLKD